ncbi:pentapeptide repeat-containing protein [Pseudomonas sp. CDFA 602]|uniref:pentapeptide repeat-containing protein n=1 Tax=Pseudomonas californiensis TaxID=2829823 RepID=UPI001E650321|nr:pentapeptide repeat-containing protein [Pseudomonas californiensis]MCD5997293.1 pentapeptide repeat-containing protein [Pseudomonas californiensis]MCD6002891.1 pentapeptide repeat-containing protein [Pseudomonas californiensis]
MSSNEMDSAEQRPNGQAGNSSAGDKHAADENCSSSGDVAVNDSAPVAEKTKSQFFEDDGREKLTDVRINAPDYKIDGDQKTFYRKLLTRVSAKNITFKNVSFFQTIFDACYFNHCVFDSCIFVGCKFVGCNFNQTSFPGSNFDYAIFERTQIDDDIFKAAPERSNIKLKFARTLRMNYQQVGDAKAVNRAIVLELEATDVFLKESWSSDSSYYRKKYAGFARIAQLLKWADFKVFDFIWGNGESIAKLMRSIILVILVVGFVNMFYMKEPRLFAEFLHSLYTAPAMFLGVVPLPAEVPSLLSSGVAALRLVGFAFLTAILVKRFGRR